MDNPQETQRIGDPQRLKCRASYLK